MPLYKLNLEHRSDLVHDASTANSLQHDFLRSRDCYHGAYKALDTRVVVAVKLHLVLLSERGWQDIRDDELRELGVWDMSRRGRNAPASRDMLASASGPSITGETDVRLELHAAENVLLSTVLVEEREGHVEDVLVRDVAKVGFANSSPKRVHDRTILSRIDTAQDDSRALNGAGSEDDVVAADLMRLTRPCP